MSERAQPWPGRRWLPSVQVALLTLALTACVGEPEPGLDTGAPPDDVATESGTHSLADVDPAQCLPGPCAVSAMVTWLGCEVVYEPAGAPCDDGDLGTRDDVCNGAGRCIGTPIECPPVEACVTGWTPNGVDCTAELAADGAACNDDNDCTVDDTCIGGVCEGSIADGGTCDDGNDCTVNDTCLGGACMGQKADDGASCDDGDPCTTGDTCLGSVCSGPHAATGEACDDGDPCTTGDACLDGGCDGAALECGPGGFCAEGVCESMHCRACGNDGDCGDEAFCEVLPIGGRCLVWCPDGVCWSPGQECAMSADFEPLCYDFVGECEAPGF